RASSDRRDLQLRRNAANLVRDEELMLGRKARVATAILVVACAAVAVRIAPPSRNHPRVSAPLVCGIERRNIKTLKDWPLLLPARSTTVAWRLPAGRAVVEWWPSHAPGGGLCPWTNAFRGGR